MSGAVDHQGERQNLLTRLLDAVKQCQVRFGGRRELATEGDSRVTCLCAAWEAALSHGMRHTNKALSTLKQMTEMTGLSKVASNIGLIENIQNMETEPVFWQYVKEHLSRHEVQRYTLLRHVTTDAGRGRAWLRSTLNEHSLEKYMHMVIENGSIINNFYEDWAFLCDQERASMLPMMAAGLGSILFAINIDNPELNAIRPASGLDVILSATPPTRGYAPRAEEEPRPVIHSDHSPKNERRKERKKKKRIANIVSFDNDDDGTSSYCSTSPGSSVTSPRVKSVGMELPASAPSLVLASGTTSRTAQHFPSGPLDRAPKPGVEAKSQTPTDRPVPGSGQAPSGETGHDKTSGSQVDTSAKNTQSVVDKDAQNIVDKDTQAVVDKGTSEKSTDFKAQPAITDTTSNSLISTVEEREPQCVQAQSQSTNNRPVLGEDLLTFETAVISKTPLVPVPVRSAPDFKELRCPSVMNGNISLPMPKEKDTSMNKEEEAVESTAKDSVAHKTQGPRLDEENSQESLAPAAKASTNAPSETNPFIEHEVLVDWGPVASGNHAVETPKTEGSGSAQKHSGEVNPGEVNSAETRRVGSMSEGYADLVIGYSLDKQRDGSKEQGNGQGDAAVVSVSGTNDVTTSSVTLASIWTEVGNAVAVNAVDSAMPTGGTSAVNGVSTLKEQATQVANSTTRLVSQESSQLDATVVNVPSTREALVNLDPPVSNEQVSEGVNLDTLPVKVDPEGDVLVNVADILSQPTESNSVVSTSSLSPKRGSPNKQSATHRPESIKGFDILDRYKLARCDSSDSVPGSMSDSLRTNDSLRQRFGRWDSTDSADVRSITSNSSFGETMSSPTIPPPSLEKPMNVYSNGIASLTPVTPEGCPLEGETMTPFTGTASSEDSRSYDSIEVPSYTEDTDNAAYALAVTQQGYLASNDLQKLGATSPEAVSNDTLSPGELKQALVAMMLRKDEMEAQCRTVEAGLEAERQVNASLRAEAESLRRTNEQLEERDTERIRALCKENELLKHQLRKYVNAVQMLRTQGAHTEDIPGIHFEDPQPSIPPPRPQIDYSHEASEYEKKLIQVAEMHGELMEFNELLQRQLSVKESTIVRLKQELTDLRGPLPEDFQMSDDSVSVTSEVDAAAFHRPLVNIWIPSAFLRGTGSDAFHVYQVYVRIRDEEWNIYRRYAEFHQLHGKLRKKYPIVNTYEFPQKKTFGNRDPKFVEERRRKLQVYLRQVINLFLQTSADLVANVSRQRLLQVAPFFGDIPNTDKRNKSKRKMSRSLPTTRGAAQSPSPAAPQHYMGL